MADIWMGVIKPVILGFALVSISCFFGLKTTGGTQGVGRATTQAVVAASVAVLALDLLVTKVVLAVLY
jgi:phospholipid/cholesterol/gamma-HCH transport system permease protein